jgi:hypothetical protein
MTEYNRKKCGHRVWPLEHTRGWPQKGPWFSDPELKVPHEHDGRPINQADDVVHEQDR